MSTKNFVPYTYLIGWSKFNKWYYGVEYSNNKNKIANPSNLFTSYFTSSNYVSNFITENGNPDIIQIRKTFNNAEEARNWEYKVLKRLNVVKLTKWLNKTDNKSIINDEETMIKIGKCVSEKLKGRKITQEHIERVIATKRKNNKKMEISEENRKLIIEATHTPIANKKRSKKMKEKIWITNGVNNKRIISSQNIEEGWKLGRTLKTSEKSLEAKKIGAKRMGNQNKNKVTCFDLYNNSFTSISKESFLADRNRFCGVTSIRIPSNATH